MKYILTIITTLLLFGCNVYNNSAQLDRVKPIDKYKYTDSLGREIKEYSYYCDSLDTVVYNRVVEYKYERDGVSYKEKYKEFFNPQVGYHQYYKFKSVKKFPKTQVINDSLSIHNIYRKTITKGKREKDGSFDSRTINIKYIRSINDLLHPFDRDVLLFAKKELDNLDRNADGVADVFDMDEMIVNHSIIGRESSDDISESNKRETTQHTFNYIKGKMAYGVPDTMIVGKSYDVTLIITKEMSDERESIMVEQIKNNSRTKSRITINDIRVGNVMTAELIDGDGNFEIKSTSTSEQNIEDFDQTEWRWSVKPLKSGENPLRLIVKVRVYTEEGSYLKDIPVFDKDIYVKSNIKYDAKNWLSENWQWFMSTLVIPIFLYFWNKRKKKEK
jgi:hypothetical protein